MSTENKQFPRSTDFKNGLVANNTGDDFIAAYIQLQDSRIQRKPVEQSVPDNFNGR